MPFVALINGQRTISLDIKEVQWQFWQKNKPDIVMTCCGQKGNFRTSHLGTRHFYHLANDGCAHIGESVEHLYLKAQIYQILKGMGYPCDMEVSGNGWRADVLATINGVPTAFEIQLSPQNHEQTVYRTKRYHESGVDVHWLMEKHFELANRAGISAWHLMQTINGAWIIKFQNEVYPLEQWIDILTTPKIEFHGWLDVDVYTDIHLTITDCPTCGAKIIHGCQILVPYQYQAKDYTFLIKAQARVDAIRQLRNEGLYLWLERTPGVDFCPVCGDVPKRDASIKKIAVPAHIEVEVNEWVWNQPIRQEQNP